MAAIFAGGGGGGSQLKEAKFEDTKKDTLFITAKLLIHLFY